MNLFKDEVYESMDDLSQIVEPYINTVNDELAKIPNKIEISKELIVDCIKDSHVDNLYASNIIRDYAKNNNIEINIAKIRNNRSYGGVYDFFKIEIEEGSTYDPISDVFMGSAYLVKHTVALEDEDIKKSLIEKLNKAFSDIYYDSKNKNVKQINEICDLFNVEGYKSSRSFRYKCRLLKTKYREMIENNELNIRDYELFGRFLTWNKKYIINGNLPSFSNITKIKIMMRDEVAIYSIKEDEV